MKNQTIQEGKTLAIVSHLTFIGTGIAVLMNSENKNEYTYFYCRQMIGLIIMLFIAQITQKYIYNFLGDILWVISFFLWVYSFYFSIKGEYKLVPILGEKFQEWFKAIS